MRTVLKPKLEVHVMNAGLHILAHRPGMTEMLVKRTFKAVDNILGDAINHENHELLPAAGHADADFIEQFHETPPSAQAQKVVN